MKADSILEEVWRAKDDLAREAGGDIHRMCENARKWIAEHPIAKPAAHHAEAQRGLAAGHAPLTVHEESPPYDPGKKDAVKEP